MTTGRKRGRPPKDPSELSENPESKRKREWRNRKVGAGGKDAAVFLAQVNNRTHRANTLKKLRQSQEYLSATRDQRQEMEQDALQKLHVKL